MLMIEAAPTPASEVEELRAKVRDLETKLAEAKQMLFVASAEVSALSLTDPQRALVEHLKALAQVVNGTPLENIPEEYRTTPLLGVAEIKQNYDELWKSYETERALQGSETSVRPTVNDIERLLVALGTPYGVAQIVLLVLRPGDGTQAAASYRRAKDYLEQLLRR